MWVEHSSVKANAGRDVVRAALRASLNGWNPPV